MSQEHNDESRQQMVMLPAGTKLSIQQRRQLISRQQRLQKEWTLRSEKLTRLRQALAIEAGEAAKFQLEKQIQAEERQLDQLEDDLASLEQVLRSSATGFSSEQEDDLASDSRMSLSQVEAGQSRGIAIQPAKRSRRRQVGAVLLSSVLATGLVMGVRSQGWLQPVEFFFYDQFMQARPSQQADPRLLLVEIDDIDEQQHKYSVPDNILLKVLQKLNKHNPSTIGVDLFLDQPISPGDKELRAYLQKHKNIISMCSLGSSPEQSKSKASGISDDKVGFNDVLTDDFSNKGKTIRRMLLSRTRNPITSFSNCNPQESLSLGFLLAKQYLDKKGISVERDDLWKAGKVTFKPLDAYSGGYQDMDSRGYQIFINYRNTSHIAQSVRLREILSDRFYPNWVENKIVLIGMASNSADSGLDTPIGRIPELHFHAQAISNILSSVENGLPLIWWNSREIDGLLVLCWGLIGSLTIFLKKKLYQFLVIIFLNSSIIYVIYFIVFLKGGWLPLIPSILALSIATIGVHLICKFSAMNNRFSKI